MGRIENVVSGFAEAIGQELGYEVVEVTYGKEGPDSILRVTIDNPHGISSDDCERFSRALEAKIDEADPISGAYLLEVSSPGMERPLKKPEDFQRFVGETVELRLNAAFEGSKRWRGQLKGWDASGDGGVLIEVDGRCLTVPWKMVGRARLSPDW